jgi:plastocyanin
MSSLRLVVISIVLTSAIACGSSYSSSPAPSPSPSPAPAPAPGPASTRGGSSSPVTIPAGASTLGSSAYAPDSVNVAVGGTVTWTNSDSVAHTSTSDASGWDSGIVAPGAQFSVAFPTAGTFSYHCAIHPGMIGTVVVR